MYLSSILIKVGSKIIGYHWKKKKEKKKMITSNLPKNLRVEEENIMTLRHQAGNLMSCTGEHNLETPELKINEM